MHRFATTDDTTALDAPDGHFDDCDTLGHRPEDGVCVDCGARVPDADTVADDAAA